MNQKNNTHTVVDVDKDLEDLIEGFLNSRSQEITELENAVNADNYDPVFQIAHNLIGSGKTFGFDFISEFGSFVREAAKSRKKEEIIDEIKKIRIIFQNLTINYVDIEN